MCLLTRTIQQDALRSTDGVHTRLPDAPEASYCSRGPAEQPASLTRALRGPAERGNWNSRPDGIAERDRLASPSLSFSPQQEKRGLWKALPPDADVLADVCKSQQRVRVCECMCVCMLSSFFDAQIAYVLITFPTCIITDSDLFVHFHFHCILDLWSNSILFWSACKCNKLCNAS